MYIYIYSIHIHIHILCIYIYTYICSQHVNTTNDTSNKAIVALRGRALARATPNLPTNIMDKRPPNTGYTLAPDVRAHTSLPIHSS